MEESISFLEQINRTFQCHEVDIRTYSPLTLAYIGDAVYDMIIRTVIVERGNQSANRLHKSAIRYVNAKTQAVMIAALKEDLTETELDVYKRGKNAKSHTSAKNATIKEYRKATGFEALIGYLFLKNDLARVLELVQLGLHKVGEKI